MTPLEFISRGETPKLEIPEWFALDPNTDRFVLMVPKYDKVGDAHKAKANFKIFKWYGCIPYFETKIAGVSYEGRPDIIRRAENIIKKGNAAKAHLRYIKDVNNEHHKNALKILLMIKSGKVVLMKEACVGFIPAKLANFIRFAEDHGVEYECNKTTIKIERQWVSINTFLSPVIIGESIREEVPDDEPIRIPMVKKAITGVTVEDFRNALIRKPQKRNT